MARDAHMKSFHEFSDYLELQTQESSLRQQLRVPQNPKHHPEGDVDRHTMMVRAALIPAMNLLKRKQSDDPQGPLSNLDLNFNSEDINILRLAALLHDIGKGDALNPETLSAHGHESPKIFEKAMRRLGPVWQQMYDNANPIDKEDLWWVIKYHMSLKDQHGFENKTLKKELLDEDGNYKNKRKIKLLLTLLLMDRMGRGGAGGVEWNIAKTYAKSNVDAAEKGLHGIYATSDTRRKELQKAVPRSLPVGDDPSDIVKNLKNRGRSNDQIKMALLGMVKNGKLSLSSEEIDNLLKESMLSFKTFLESDESEPAKMKARIPLGKFEKGANLLSRVFKNARKTLYIVGGTVRDYLMSKYHDVPFAIKDVDFATNALSDQVIRILQGAGIKYIPKGAAFGVISAIVDGHEFEIATFREESGYSDKRRPSDVKASDAKNDYRRRDFTFNALFYDMPETENDEGTIIDYGGGRGFEDIKAKRVSTVGSAHERFSEDPLRVLRGVRFHGIFNTEHLKDVVDPETLEAMKRFRELEGVSPERIQAEFVASLLKARDPRVALHGFETIGALPYMFPGMVLDMDAVDHLQNLPQQGEFDDAKKHSIKKVILTLALLLRKSGTPEQIRKKLNDLKWPNEIVDEVASLVKSWQITLNPNADELSQHAVSLFKKNQDFRRELLKDFHPMIGHEVDSDHLSHLSRYEPAKFNGEEVQKASGKKGPALGMHIRQLQAADYDDSFNRHKKQNPF